MGYLVLTSFHNSTPFWLAFLIGIMCAERAISCPPNCTCQNVEVNCEGNNLRTFPNEIPLLTRRLVLANNSIVYITHLELSYLNELVYLDFSHNRLLMGTNFTFPLLPELTSLDLSYNHISQITGETFSKLEHLLLLNLSGNRYLHKLDDNTFRHNPLLRYLDISGCNFSYISREVFKRLKNFHSLDISANPFDCNCHVLEFMEWMKNKMDDKELVFPHIEETTCKKPLIFYDMETLSILKRLIVTCRKSIRSRNILVASGLGIFSFACGILTASMVGMATVVYHYPLLKIDDDSDDDMFWD
ncbi:leucine-rich repeat-containing protein 52-like [Hemicordylus capensis]|uniref:leucine-rich repeat-containing protein 52-like n=1 Tax=Hemicordylus capensis TaxID=884348 RepID=UPI002303C349|nr:leucine-rich repeat-containing protein 52-like [Hemicordylus capensis]